jgi:hypothetical protein
MGREKFLRQMLLIGAALPASAWPYCASAQETSQPDSGDSGQIVVLGILDRGVFDSASIEDELNEADIAAYGQDTVGDLLAEIGSDLGEDDDGPVILVNGQLATGADDISDLPSEAVARIQLLPSQASAAIGQAPGRRVINVVVKPQHRQITLTAEGNMATAGRGRIGVLGATMTRIDNGNRTNVSLRVRDVAPLHESDRDLVSRPAGSPFDLVGNLVPAQPSALEIDPGLSALVGRPVAVAGVPAGAANPTLGQFVAGADNPNSGDITNFRSLIADSRSYGLNATLTRRLAPNTNVTATMRGDLTKSSRDSTAPSALLQLPAASPFSPFGSDVAIARYLPFALVNERRSTGISTAVVLNHSFDAWNLSVSADWNHREEDARNGRAAELDPLRQGIASGAINPFAQLPPEYRGIARFDRTSTTTDVATFEATIAGLVAQLPAGPLSFTTTVGAAIDRLDGYSTLSGIRTGESFQRKEGRARSSVEIPLSSTSADEPSALGALSLNLHAGIRDASIVGTLFDHGVSFNWTPRPIATFRGSLEYSQRAPAVSRLIAPSEQTAGVRYYDPVRGETVDVTFITGGNPALGNESREVLTIGTTITPQQRKRRFINIEYTHERVRNSVSDLPQGSFAIQQAFPDRFIRDAAGRIVLIDSRPVVFFRDTREQLRTGINVSDEFGPAMIGGTRRLGSSGDAPEGAAAPPTNRAFRYNVSLSHFWTFADERLVSTLGPLIDFLDGGAAGFGGGQPRHSVVGNRGVSHRSGGVQVSGRWRGPSALRAGAGPGSADLRFSATSTVNLQAFAEMGELFPQSGLAKGLRVTVSVNNLFDDYQVVRDGSGVIPLRYQRYLLDPLGRTVGLAIRKAI